MISLSLTTPITETATSTSLRKSFSVYGRHGTMTQLSPMISRSAESLCSLNSGAFDTSTLNPMVTMIALFEQRLDGSVISVVVKSWVLQTSYRKPRNVHKAAAPAERQWSFDDREGLRGQLGHTLRQLRAQFLCDSE